MKKKLFSCLAIIVVLLFTIGCLVACDEQSAPQRFDVTFITTGDIPAQTTCVNQGEKLTEPSAPTKDGYTFVAWKNAADNKVWDFDTDTVNGDTVLYATWEIIPVIKTYRVTYDAQGGAPVKFVTAEEGTKLEMPSAPTKEGYTFVAWKNAADNEVWNFETDTVNGDIVLYADWEAVPAAPRDCIVIVDSKNGEENKYINVKEGDKLTELPAPIKYGYDFAGWKNIATDELWDFDNDVVRDTVVLFADWTEWTKHLVTFDSDGANKEAPIDSFYVYDGEKIEQPKDSVYSKPSFKYWINSANGEEWDFENDTVTSDVELCAIWQINLLMYNFGMYEQFSVITRTPMTVDDLNAFVFGYSESEKLAYDYEWSAGGKKIEFDESGFYSFTYAMNGTIISQNKLPKTFTVTLDSGSATVITEMTYGQKFSLPVYYKEGYEFLGWFDANDSTAKQYADADGNGLRNWSTASDITLFAVFEELPQYTVAFDTDGGSDVPSASVKKYGKVSAPADPTRDSDEFLYWKDGATNKVWDFKKNEVLSDVSLYAVWRTEIAIKFIGEAIVDTTMLADTDRYYSKAEILNAIQPDGANLQEAYDISWGIEYNGALVMDELLQCWVRPTADMDFGSKGYRFDKASSIRIYLTAKEFDITLNLNDDSGADSSSATVVYGQSYILPVPVKECARFLGWFDNFGEQYADENGESLQSWTITENTELFAHWEILPKKYIVVLDFNNGEPAQYKSVELGGKIDEPEVADRYGFDFAGWKNAATDALWDFENDIAVNNTLLVAQWTERTKYQVTFIIDDETVYTQCYVYEGEKAVKPQDPTSDVDTFKCWYNDETGEEWDFNNIVDSDLTLRVVWNEKLFIKPCNGTILTAYSEDVIKNETTSQWESHTAIDFVSDDLAVYAAADGVIKQVGNDDLNGNYVIIEHIDGYVTKYFSLDEVTLEVGTHVTQGQVIGQMSDSRGIEYLKGAHLHFEVTKDGNVIDPTSLMDLT